MLRLAAPALAALTLLAAAPTASAVELDPGFADRGVLKIPNSDDYSEDVFNAVIELDGGRIVAAGGYLDEDAGTGGPVLVGLDRAGNFDPGFGGDGTVDGFVP